MEFRHSMVLAGLMVAFSVLVAVAIAFYVGSPEDITVSIVGKSNEVLTFDNDIKELRIEKSDGIDLTVNGYVEKVLVMDSKDILVRALGYDEKKVENSRNVSLLILPAHTPTPTQTQQSTQEQPSTQNSNTNTNTNTNPMPIVILITTPVTPVTPTTVTVQTVTPTPQEMPQENETVVIENESDEVVIIEETPTPTSKPSPYRTPIGYVGYVPIYTPTSSYPSYPSSNYPSYPKSPYPYSPIPYSQKPSNVYPYRTPTRYIGYAPVFR